MRGAALFAAAAALVATAAPAQVDPRTPAVLAAIHAQLGNDGFGPNAQYAIAFSDLNDDHYPEAVIHVAGPNFCGSGGCTTFVLTEAEAGWLPLGRITASRLPIYRLPEHHNGWFDLAVYVGGGGMQPGLRTLRFAKGRYASNPTKAPATGRLPLQASPLLPVTSEVYRHRRAVRAAMAKDGPAKAGERDLASLLRDLSPRLDARRFTFAIATELALGPDDFAIIREEEGPAVIRVDPDGDWARISLEVHSSLEAVGLTAALSTNLAEAGISANIVAGLRHDHLFVPWARRDEALNRLKSLAKAMPLS